MKLQDRIKSLERNALILGVLIILLASTLLVTQIFHKLTIDNLREVDNELVIALEKSVELDTNMVALQTQLTEKDTLIVDVLDMIVKKIEGLESTALQENSEDNNG